MHGSIGRAGASRFTSTAPQQQQQQYGGGMPSSSNRHAEGAHRGPDRLGAGLGKGIHQGAAGAAAAGPGSYLSNGIAGVLHSSVPTNSSSPSSHAPLHSYRNAAAAPGAGSSAAAGMGPSSIAAMGAGGGAGGGGMTGMLGSMQQGGAVGAKAGGSNLAGGKVPGGLTAQQHPFAYAGNMAGGSRPMHGFGPVAAGAAKVRFALGGEGCPPCEGHLGCCVMVLSHCAISKSVAMPRCRNLCRSSASGYATGWTMY